MVRESFERELQRLQDEMLVLGSMVENAIIESVAAQAGLGLLDTNALLEQLSTTGITSNGFTLRADYVTGGAFSMDGIHLNARGYALLANEFLKVIDDTFDSNFEEAGALVDIGEYPAFYPASLP